MGIKYWAAIAARGSEGVKQCFVSNHVETSIIIVILET